MEKTEHLELNKWAQTDRILMDDFNSDNDKLDAALGDLMGTVETHTATLAQHAALLPKLGNCQIYTTSYVGNYTGTYTLTFPKPVVAMMTIIAKSTESSLAWTPASIWVAGGKLVVFSQNGTNTKDEYTISPDGCTLTFTGRTDGGASDFMNGNGITYLVTALLAADQ